ncbi:ATP-binding protein [Nakamurella sp. A5-74]|uniref:ATP-binding protein n=1 Tax=Nakamurella sp. A5-74 TaxID=3158264 RepID=A0AAU8DWM2_9ACTN
MSGRHSDGPPSTRCPARRHQVTLLRAEVDSSLTSHGGLVIVAGEVGIGKSALIGTAMEQARAAGFLALAGTCWDSDAAPELWPWTQLIRAMHRSLGAAEFLRHQRGARSSCAARQICSGRLLPRSSREERTSRDPVTSATGPTIGA